MPKSIKPKKPRAKQNRTKKIVASAGAIVVKQDAKGRLTAKEDGRSKTSAFNHMQSGKFANLPTLLCNYCPYGASDNSVGGSGQCQVYKKDSACGLEHKYRSVIEQYDTRDINTLTKIVDNQILARTVRANMLTQFSVWDGGIPDRLMDRNDGYLIQFIKLQSELTAPRLQAKQTQINRGADGSMESLIQEIFVNAKPAEISENTIGMKTTTEDVHDSVQAIKEAEHKDLEDMM